MNLSGLTSTKKISKQQKTIVRRIFKGQTEEQAKKFFSENKTQFPFSVREVLNRNIFVN